MRRPPTTIVGLFLGCLTLSACGFVGSGTGPNNKPDAFLMHGYVSVAIGDGTGAAPGTPCTTPAATADIRAGGPVRVADPEGHTLGAGQLGAGVSTVDGGKLRCNFPFEIRAVPGGVEQYVIGVGDRPPVSFPARELRENKPAVITVEG
jgi:hypothetical protein